MSYGERATIEGVLSMVKPQLALEIGRAEGGSLRRISAHSELVLSFDIVEPAAELEQLANVTMFTGDSHEQLPRELESLASEQRQVDFVLVDGDHTAAGVRQDMRDLLDSPAVTRTVILAHDTLNEDVRAGLASIDYAAYEKVAWVDLDFIPGYVARLPARLGEVWGGLGLVVVDASGDFRGAGPRSSDDLFDHAQLVWPAAEWIRRQGTNGSDFHGGLELVAASELVEAEGRCNALSHELERHRAWLRGIEGSASWRLTAPLRALKRRLLGRG
jgi:hypothetical protein